MLKFIVINISINTQSEADEISSKSSDNNTNASRLVYKDASKLIDIMEDDDDVQNVWHNWEE